MHKINMIWMKQKEFWAYFEKQSDPVKINFDSWCYFGISEGALRKNIDDISPNHDLQGEADPPGPVSRWYGNLMGIPVILDFYSTHPNGEIVEIYHGGKAGSREIVREYFADWGDGWQESKIA